MPEHDSNAPTLESIENEIVRMTEKRLQLRIVSERVPYVSDLIYDKFFAEATPENQLVLKDVLTRLLFKYSNLNGSPLIDATIAEVLYACSKIKVSAVSDIIIHSLRSRNLEERNYEGRDLNLIALQVLADIPFEYRIRDSLLQLFNNQYYRSKVSYCLHFLELFARKNLTYGVDCCLDAMLDLQLSESEVNDVSLQLYVTFRLIAPQTLLEWYEGHLLDPNKLNRNLFCNALLGFVDLAARMPSHYGADWHFFLSLVRAFSESYQVDAAIEDIKRVMVLEQRVRQIKDVAPDLIPFLDDAMESAVSLLKPNMLDYESVTDLAGNGIPVLFMIERGMGAEV